MTYNSYRFRLRPRNIQGRIQSIEKLLVTLSPYALASTFIIDREARKIMHLVASICPSVCPFVGISIHF